MFMCAINGRFMLGKRFINRAAIGVRGLCFTFGLLNRAAVGWAVSCSAFGLFLTPQPWACAVLVLERFFF